MKKLRMTDFESNLEEYIDLDSYIELKNKHRKPGKVVFILIFPCLLFLVATFVAFIYLLLHDSINGISNIEIRQYIVFYKSSIFSTVGMIYILGGCGLFFLANKQFNKNNARSY